jgi:hypothetical protein
MDHGKYIMVDYGGIPTPILFPCFLQHCDIAEGFGSLEILSAGSFEVGHEATKNDPENIGVSVFGRSTTLDKTPNTADDPHYIRKLLRNQY